MDPVVRHPTPSNPLGPLPSILVMLTVQLAACGGGGGGTAEKPPSESEPRRGGTLVIGHPSDFDAFSEFVSVDYETKEAMGHMVFMTLVQYEPDLILRPYLAESWEVAADGLSMTFHLRQDVRWHDGRPTTAEDAWSGAGHAGRGMPSAALSSGPASSGRTSTWSASSTT